MSSMLAGNCKGCTLSDCNHCQEAIEREQELIQRERETVQITNRLEAMRHELMSLYDETEFLSDKSVHSLHELITKMYQTESLIKEMR